MGLVDLREIPSDGEEWESFARDFLIEVGFSIDTPPDRGADGGKDLLVIEHLSGHLNRYPFRWLVSCKHFAHSGRSVSEREEPNILERLRSMEADGFLGFYSTIPSSGLNRRLHDLRDARSIKDYRIFDAALIENYCLRIGYSKLLLRYCPESYVRVKPLHLLFDEYLALECEICERDLLQDADRYSSNVIFASKVDRPQEVHGFFWVCKGNCDHRLSELLRARSFITSWEDIGDLVIPMWYLKWIVSGLNARQSRQVEFSGTAHRNYRHFLFALGQKVFREMTEEERNRVGDLLELEELV